MNYDDGDDSHMAVTIKVEIKTNKKKNKHNTTQHNTAPPQGRRLFVFEAHLSLCLKCIWTQNKGC